MFGGVWDLLVASVWAYWWCLELVLVAVVGLVGGFCGLCGGPVGLVVVVLGVLVAFLGLLVVPQGIKPLLIGLLMKLQLVLMFRSFLWRAAMRGRQVFWDVRSLLNISELCRVNGRGCRVGL